MKQQRQSWKKLFPTQFTNRDGYSLTLYDQTASSIKIKMTNEEPVAGVQITMQGCTLEDVYGGSTQTAGFVMAAGANGVVMGFSLGGNNIPPGTDVHLCTLTISAISSPCIGFDPPAVGSNYPILTHPNGTYEYEVDAVNPVCNGDGTPDSDWCTNTTPGGCIAFIPHNDPWTGGDSWIPGMHICQCVTWDDTTNSYHNIGWPEPPCDMYGPLVWPASMDPQDAANECCAMAGGFGEPNWNTGEAGATYTGWPIEHVENSGPGGDSAYNTGVYACCQVEGDGTNCGGNGPPAQGTPPGGP